MAVRGPVEFGRLIWSARAEASRLHRLAVQSAHLIAEQRQRLDAMDARIYRCLGCGGWRYLSEHRHLPGSSRACHSCGAGRPIRKAVA